jgi:hypothetical protein
LKELERRLDARIDEKFRLWQEEQDRKLVEARKALVSGYPHLALKGMAATTETREAEVQEVTFAVGDNVRMRDSEDEAWRAGTVTAVSPLKVRPDGWPAASTYRFKFVEFVKKATAGAAEAEVICTPERLDKGGMWTCSESLWDASAFIGTRCLGPSCSAVIALSCFLNLLVQTTFTAIVGYYMLEPTIDNEGLDQLVKFRLGTAHDIKYADTVGMQSLATQVCDGSKKLHMATDQTNLVDDIRDFVDGGPPLCLLAEFLWLATIMCELASSFNLLRALLNTRRGPETRIILADSSGHEDDTPAEDELHTLLVTTRLTMISKTRIVAVIFGVIIPRAAIAVALGVTGVLFLAKSNAMADLVLNAIALAFVIEIDELLYPILTPRRAKTFIGNLEPLPVPCRPYGRLGQATGLHALLKGCVLFVLIFIIQGAVISPVVGKLRQAEQILCSGNTEFVTVTNPATRIVHAAKSIGGDLLWDASELFTFQLAEMDLMVDPTWDNEDLLSRAAGYDHIDMATIEPESYDGSRLDFDETEFNSGAFTMLGRIAIATEEDVAVLQPCSDMSAGQSKEALSMVLNLHYGMDNCLQVPLEYCRTVGLNALRALCPRHCMCHFPFGAASFFSTKNFGCPSQCVSEEPSWQASDYPIPVLCEDIPNEWFLPPSNESIAYYNYAFVPDTYHPDADLWMPAYIRGYIGALFEYFYAARYGFKQSIILALPHLIEWQVLPESRYEEMKSHVAGGNLTPSMFHDGLLLPGFPHPEGVKGCEFLANWLVKFLYSIDLCEPGEFLSIRAFCPKACLCGHGMAECPLKCNDNQALASSPPQGGSAGNASGNASRRV